MRFEQLRHLIETVETGSISEASKNLYISQQGLSDSLRRLENEVGFPILVRNKKGCTLNKQGEAFYVYAKKAAEAYQDMLDYLAKEKNQTLSDDESVMLYVNPLLTNVLAYNLLQDKSLKNIKIMEASISQTVTKIAEGQPILGIFLLMDMDSQIASFKNQLKNEAKLVPLFEDEIVACLAESSPLAMQETIDVDRESIFRADFDTNYYEYFDMPDENMASTIVRSNDLNLHLKLMLENNAVSITSMKLFKYMYNHPQIITRKFSQPKFATFYMLYNDTTVQKYPKLKEYIIKIQRMIKNLVGE